MAQHGAQGSRTPRSSVDPRISGDPLAGAPGFDDDDLVDTMVKSLITSTGLQSGWQRVRKRLAAVEDGLGRVRTAIDDREFVFRDEYSDLVETRHAGQLSQLSSELASLSGLHGELAAAVRDQMQPELSDCSEKLQVAHGRLGSLESEARALKGTSDELRETVQRVERSVEDHMAQSSRDVDARFAALEAAVRAQAQDTSDKMREQEERIQAWTVKEIKRVALELMDPDEPDTDDEGVEEEEAQDGDSAPLQVRQPELPTGGGEHLSVEAAASAGGDNEFRKSSKKSGARSNMEASSGAGVDGSKSTEPKGAVQKKVMELVKRTIADPLTHDITLNTARLAALEERTAKKTEDLARQIRVAEKSLDNFKGITGATTEEIREELENCFKASTAAQLETALTSSVGELWTDLQELRQTATSKLNEFVEHFAKIHESIEDHEHCLRHHAEEIEGRCTKYEMLACQRELDETVTKEEFVRELADFREMLGWQSNKIEGFGLVAASSQNRRARTAGFAGAANKGSGAMADSRSTVPAFRGTAGEDEGDAASRNQRMLTEQLNALAMGVVWLAHLLLQEPKIGASRGQRLAQERELLEELGSLRHWITHQSSPAGWDLRRLTTATLECAHPHAASPRQPHPSTAPAATPRSSAPMPSVKEKHVMSAREVRDWTNWVGEKQRSMKPPNSARALKESRGSVNAASLSTFASDGDVRSNQTSRERLPSVGRSRGGAEDLKASPASSATSLPPVRAAAA